MAEKSVEVRTYNVKVHSDSYFILEIMNRIQLQTVLGPKNDLHIAMSISHQLGISQQWQQDASSSCKSN